MFGPARKKEEPLNSYHKDLAASVQKITEQTIFYMLEKLQKENRPGKSLYFGKGWLKIALPMEK